MALRSVNLLSTSQRLFGSSTSTGADYLGGWTGVVSGGEAKATTTLTISGATNNTYSSTADKTFSVTYAGTTYSFIANANFTVSGGSATVAVTAAQNGYEYNDSTNKGFIPNSSTFTTSSSVGGSATAGAISGGRSNPAFVLVPNNSIYFQYTPGDFTSSIGNILAGQFQSTADIVVSSPAVALGDAKNILATTVFASETELLTVEGVLRFRESPTGSVIDTTSPKNSVQVKAENRNSVILKGTAPDNANYVQMVFTISPTSGSITPLKKFLIFDPVIADFTYTNSGDIAELVYSDMPNFMLVDDKEINDLSRADLGTKTQGTLTLSSCTNGLYPANTEFTVTVDSVTYSYVATNDFTVSSGAATVGIVSKHPSIATNDVTHGGVIPNGSNQFKFSGNVSSGTATAGTGDANGLINGVNGTTGQMDLPLRNYIAALTYPLDVIFNSTKDFYYTHATEGTLSRSTLTDPRTAPASYLPWIASITGSTLLSSASGFTPWTALEAYDGDSGGDPGEWEDFEVLSNWNALQDLNPDFFDELQSHRDQLTTGFTGILSGKIETMEAFIATLLDTDTPDNYTHRVTNNKFNSPFRIQSLVDPAVDPDAGGTLVKDALDAGAPAGAIAASTNNVIESGNGSYDISGILTGTLTGAQVVPNSFIDDRDGFNRNILLNTGATGDIGGGIGTSQYTADSSYLYGESGFVVTKKGTFTPSFDIGGDDTAFDIIVELTNFTPFSAAAWTSTNSATGSQPNDWFLREKRLLVCGADYNGTSSQPTPTGGTPPTTAHDNDWALYLVSGNDISADSKMRLLWIEGYMVENDTNYKYSSEIDMSTATQYGPIVFRVSKSASDVVKFYVQSSIYDDWEANALTTFPSGAITPSIDPATAGDAAVQIGGTLSNSKWSDASALPAAFRRVMINNSVFSFTGSGSTSSENHAYVDGGGVNDFGAASYKPLLDVDFSGVAKHADDFDAKHNTATATINVPTTVRKAATNDVNFLAMEPHGTHGNLWYFGDNDTLAVAGLPSASYDWRVVTVNPANGALVNNDVTGTTATSFSWDDSTNPGTFLNGGASLVSIDIIPNGGSFGANGAQSGASVAYFTPSTIGAAANPASATGTDNKSKTWTLTRAFPTVTAAYAPSQIIDKPAIQAFKGAPVIAEAPELEHYTPFAIAMQVRRHWKATSGTEYNIFSLLNTEGSPQGLKIFYEDNKLKARFTNGTVDETVSYTETTFGGWKNVVVQRDPRYGFQLWVNGVKAEIAQPNINITRFVNPTSVGTFGQGTASQYFARFGLSHFTYFDRLLTVREISLLNSQLT